MFSRGLVEADQQVERPLRVEHFGNHLAVHGRGDQIVDVVAAQTVLLEPVAVDLDA